MEATSYRNIALSLGADSPADLLFATDNPAEARAAAEAGWQVSHARDGGSPGFPLFNLVFAVQAARVVCQSKEAQDV